MLRLAILTALLAVSLGGLALAAEDQVPLPECGDNPSEYASDPLADQHARDAFTSYVSRLAFQSGKTISIPSEFWDLAPGMTRWGYEASPNADGSCQIRIVQSFRIDDLVARIREVVWKIRKDGCSFFSAKSPVITIQRRSIDFAAGISGKTRTCFDTPFGYVKTDTGTIDGNVSGRFGFRTEQTTDTGRFRGMVVGNDPEIAFDIDISFLGIGSHTFVGSMLSGILRLNALPMVMSVSLGQPPFWKALNSLDLLYRDGLNPNITANYVVETDGGFTTKGYLAFLQDLHSAAWSVQPFFALSDQLTAFDKGTTPPQIDIVFVGAVKMDRFKTLWRDIIKEMKIIRSFGTRTRLHTVMGGESLWRIAEAEYGNGFYAHLLISEAAPENAALREVLQPGDVVHLPPLHALAPLQTAHVITIGETVWGLCAKWFPGEYARCRDAMRTANPGLQPARIYALQQLKRPQSLADDPSR